MAYYETYLWTWIAYLVASLGMYYVVIKTTKYWRSFDLKSYFRMICAVILFPPASHSIDGASAIAPAYIVFFGEFLTNGFKASLQGLLPLLGVLLLGAVLLTIEAWFRASRIRKAKT